RAGGPRSDAGEERQRDEAEEADAAFDRAEDAEQRQSADRRQAAAGETAETEPDHERRHDDGDRLDIDAVKGEQRALPDDLIQQRGETGEEEQRVEAGSTKHGIGEVIGRTRASD